MEQENFLNSSARSAKGQKLRSPVTEMNRLSILEDIQRGTMSLGSPGGLGRQKASTPGLSLSLSAACLPCAWTYPQHIYWCQGLSLETCQRKEVLHNALGWPSSKSWEARFDLLARLEYYQVCYSPACHCNTCPTWWDCKGCLCPWLQEFQPIDIWPCCFRTCG